MKKAYVLNELRLYIESTYEIWSLTQEMELAESIESTAIISENA